MSESPDQHRADLGKDPGRVSGMFDEVAAGYDRTNTVLSLGNDRLWRVAATRAIAPRAGQRILDLAAGTGASAVALARSGAVNLLNMSLLSDMLPAQMARGAGLGVLGVFAPLRAFFMREGLRPGSGFGALFGGLRKEIRR